MSTDEIRLPLYTYLLQDASGAMFVGRPPKELFLPLFTSRKNAEDYAQRAGIKCVIVELTTKAVVRDFVSNPPSRAPESLIDFDIFLDPIAPNAGEYTRLNRFEFLASLKKTKERKG